jgi:hypothetical protein
LVAVGTLGTQLPGPLASVAAERTPEPSVVVHMREPSVVVLVRRRVQGVAFAVVVALPWVQLLDSTAGTERGPCRPSSHHGRLIFHSGYTRKPQVGWGDNSIAPVEVPGWDHQH